MTIIKNDLPSISAIIPTFRRGAFLVNTLGSLAKQTRHPDEILVIDQTPVGEYDESTMNFLRNGNSQGLFRWIQLTEPSVSKARNRAAQETQCDILLYLDDDIEPTQNLIELHLNHFQNCNVHAIVGPVLRKQDQKFTTVPENFLTRSIVEQAFTYSGRFDQPLAGIGFIWACNFSVRRNSLISVGGWDERIINYGDRDLGIRLAKDGYRIDYDPAAYIIHLNAPMGGTRATDSTLPWQGWQRCVSLFYLGFRHLNGWMFLKYGLYRAARFSFLLKKNATRPWRWPTEIFGFSKAFFVGKRWARKGPKLPLLVKK